MSVQKTETIRELLWLAHYFAIHGNEDKAREISQHLGVLQRSVKHSLVENKAELAPLLNPEIAHHLPK